LKAAGFSIIEVLVATAVVAVGVASLAHLFVVSAHTTRIAGTTSVTLLLAEQKMEELLSAGPDDPGEAGNQNHVEYLDQSGVSLGLTSTPHPGTPPSGTAYICRWSIEPLPDRPATAIVVQVLVVPWPHFAGQTRLIGVKTRRAR
jgi:prepilin-type N-terminal cleavage/methylation domain-containing protein